MTFYIWHRDKNENSILSFLMSCLFIFGVFYSGAVSRIAHAETAKVGGDYKVSLVEKNETGFSIVFESVVNTGKNDKLVLNSTHVHDGIEQGMIVRLSAEILDSNSKNGIQEVSQVLIYFNTNQGRTPVWLISRNKPSKNLNGASRYIEMHAPTSDYLLF